MTNNLKNSILTDRMLIRPIDIQDIDDVFAYRADEETNRFQFWIPKTKDDVRHFIESKVSAEINIPETWFQFVLIRLDNKELIGDIGVHFIDAEGFQAEIGITISRNHQMKGFASEALRKIIDYLFDELSKRRITASVDPRNEGSMMLMKSLGFRQEAHFKESILHYNEWVDDIVFAMLKDEWKGRVDLNKFFIRMKQ